MMTSINHTMEVWVMRDLKLNITDKAREKLMELGPEVTIFQGTIGVG